MTDKTHLIVWAGGMTAVFLGTFFAAMAFLPEITTDKAAITAFGGLAIILLCVLLITSSCDYDPPVLEIAALLGVIAAAMSAALAIESYRHFSAGYPIFFGLVIAIPLARISRLNVSWGQKTVIMASAGLVVLTAMLFGIIR